MAAKGGTRTTQEAGSRPSAKKSEKGAKRAPHSASSPARTNKTAARQAAPRTRPPRAPAGSSAGGGADTAVEQPGTPARPSPPAGASVAQAGAIRIRMYRIGFGDCFLVSLPVAAERSDGGYKHVLVDCGVHSRGDIGTMSAIVDNIAAVTGKRLAVVIATHAHQDHIAGFDRFGNVFSTFEIGEVWLPWTWNPGDAQAVQLQKKRAALTNQLAQHFTALAAVNPGSTKPETIAAIENMKGNPHAISLLKAGFGVNAKVRYLRAGDRLPQPNDALPIPGLSVQFLGPPQDQKFLAQMNPPAGQHYLRLAADGQPETANGVEPFGKRWRLNGDADPFKAFGFTSRDEKTLQTLIGSPLEALAFTIDQALNNESVVALMVYRGQYLLFPGDAQYGNWEWWLQNLQPETILPMIRFLKVAHHGSMNATPKDALEKMSDGKFAAMVSTQSTPWASIPLVNLMQRVDQKAAGRIVRSDWLDVKGAPSPSAGAAPAKPPQWPQGFTQGDLWFDHVIDPS